jgi:hypothetical protein
LLEIPGRAGLGCRLRVGDDVCQCELRGCLGKP